MEFKLRPSKSQNCSNIRNNAPTIASLYVSKANWRASEKFCFNQPGPTFWIEPVGKSRFFIPSPAQHVVRQSRQVFIPKSAVCQRYNLDGNGKIGIVFS